MTTHCDTSLEVVPSDLPQAIYPHGEHDNWSRQGHNGYTSPTGDYAYRNDSQYYQQSSSPLPTKAEAESQVQTAPASDTGNKPKRRCSCLVIALIIALVVACAAIVALAAVTGITIKQKQDSESEVKALHVSLSASVIPTSTTTSVSPSATQDDEDDISNGCSAKEEEVSDTTYTSEFKPFPRFTMYCNRNAPNPPVYSVFASSLHGCVEACASWNTFPSGESQKCEAVSFIPAWSNMDTAAGIPAAGNCYLKPGPQTKSKLEGTNGTTHAAILKS